MNVIPSYLSFSMQNQNQKYSLGFLASVTRLECGPMNQRVVGSIPGQSTCLDCGFDPRLGHV